MVKIEMTLLNIRSTGKKTGLNIGFNHDSSQIIIQQNHKDIEPEMEDPGGN